MFPATPAVEHRDDCHLRRHLRRRDDGDRAAGGLVIADYFTGIERRLLDIDTVVTTESRGDDGLYRALKGCVKELFMIGDCVTPRKVDGAVREALAVCRSL